MFTFSSVKEKTRGDIKKNQYEWNRETKRWRKKQKEKEKILLFIMSRYWHTRTKGSFWLSVLVSSNFISEQAINSCECIFSLKSKITKKKPFIRWTSMFGFGMHSFHFIDSRSLISWWNIIGSYNSIQQFRWSLNHDKAYGRKEKRKASGNAGKIIRLMFRSLVVVFRTQYSIFDLSFHLYLNIDVREKLQSRTFRSENWRYLNTEYKGNERTTSTLQSHQNLNKTNTNNEIPKNRKHDQK